ncbi:hypothetical protein MHSWG343_10210 [Candidatus Mycoplasma haematohominis]|uniref:Uncharacterized protein n=1 Tax=Candidatus Mycoplasma haematohominis TaxID=1494318 RepID=A0A478FR82_9MOLU|nr:hypothetical protein MHSWG343_10210 [Candidatus Mycoplasma haemohominis]
MSVFKVVGTVIVFVSALGGGGYFAWDYFIDTEIRSLDNSKYEENTFGKRYGIYLLDPFNRKNKDAWEALFNKWNTDKDKTRPSPQLSNEFQKGKIDKGYSNKEGEEDKSLNKVCKTIFEQAESQVTNDKKTNTWTYCSLLGEETKLISTTEKTEYNNKFGGKDEFQNKLVVVKKSGTTNANEAFWSRRNKEFFDEINLEDTSGKHASKDSIFATLYEKKHQQRREINDTVRDTCEKAYDKKITGGDEKIKFTEEDIKRFCFLIPE